MESNSELPTGRRHANHPVPNPFLNRTVVCDRPRRLPVPLGVFGNYELLSIAGHGSGGVVYRARRLADGAIVAVKVFLGVGYQPNLRARLQSECRLAINHPNLMPVLDSNLAADLPYFVMPFCEKSLGQYAAEQDRLDPDEAVGIVVQVLRGLICLHASKIVHRDLKPDNILFDATGQVRVADFGIACELSEPMRQSQIGRGLGTPGYLSPEQAKGNLAAVNFPTDVWSIGCVLYRLLSGQVPYGNLDSDSTMRRAREGNPLPLAQVWPSGDPKLIAVVDGCLQSDPANRPYTADLLGNLQSWRANHPLRHPLRNNPTRRLFDSVTRRGACVLVLLFVLSLMAPKNRDRTPNVPKLNSQAINWNSGVPTTQKYAEIAADLAAHRPVELVPGGQIPKVGIWHGPKVENPVSPGRPLVLVGRGNLGELELLASPPANFRLETTFRWLSTQPGEPQFGIVFGTQRHWKPISQFRQSRVLLSLGADLPVRHRHVGNPVPLLQARLQDQEIPYAVNIPLDRVPGDSAASFGDWRTLTIELCGGRVESWCDGIPVGAVDWSTIVAEGKDLIRRNRVLADQPYDRRGRIGVVVQDGSVELWSATLESLEPRVTSPIP